MQIATGEENGKRSSLHGQWSGRFAFILAVTGSAVGLGNIWKFPYVAGENGNNTPKTAAPPKALRRNANPGTLANSIFLDRMNSLACK